MTGYHQTGVRRAVAAVCLTAACLSGGCAALSNPVVDGIPVRRLPPEAFGESREALKPVNLADLTPRPPDAYRIGPGDVLGVFVEGILGKVGEAPPVRIPEQGTVPPGIGFPLPVREDGTLPLPLLKTGLVVSGLTLAEVERRIVAAYTGTKLPTDPGQPPRILNPETAKVIVTLLRPRTYHVLVLREDAGGSTFGTTGGFNTFGSGGTFVSETRRAAGFPLDLPAYENDLINALTRTGGLPGFEAEDEVVIERGAYRPAPGAAPPVVGAADDYIGRGRETIRVPLRAHPGEPLTLKATDLVLQTGDIVLVRARRGQLFYTGGLLPARAFPLPRDRDLDVLEALAIVGGPILNGGLNANNLNGTLLQSGLGFPSPSQVTVLRRLKCGTQIPISVSLNRAVKDPRERLVIQPGDFLILQQTPGEAVAQYVTTNLRLNFLGTIIRQADLTGTANATLP
jgi:hypothetical protein